MKTAKKPQTKISRRDTFGFPIIVIEGEVDFYSCPELLRMLQECSAGRSRRVALDLAKVRRLDESGAWLLLTTEEHLRAQGRKLDLLDASAQVCDTLRRNRQRLAQVA